MSADTAFLALLLDAPLMSFGHASRFQRRTTALHPTRSALWGMICAAAGAARGSPAEAEWLARLEAVRLTVLTIPRQPGRGDQPLPIRRLEDYHTVLDTRRASGSISKDAVITRRQYLLDARFGVVLAGPRDTLAAIADVLRDPRWGVWFGRKNCIPAAPVVRGGPVPTPADALAGLGLAGHRLEDFERVEDAATFADGTDTLMDSPLDFRTRTFRPRRIARTPASSLPPAAGETPA